MNDIIPSISQSIIKDFRAYELRMECGLQFKAKYVDNIKFPSSEAQALGNYFEYLVTGALTRHGEIPRAVYLQDGQTLSKPFQIMHNQAKRALRYMEYYQVNILDKGVHVVTNDGESGTYDVLAEVGPDQILTIIDIKTTGLLYDKWNEFGWHEDAIGEKHRIMIQPLHYVHIGKKKYGEDLPFQFWVFSQKNDIDAELFRVNLDPEKQAAHQYTIDSTREKLSLEMAIGFTAYPELKRCHECPIKESCSFAIDVPAIKTIDY